MHIWEVEYGKKNHAIYFFLSSLPFVPTYTVYTLRCWGCPGETYTSSVRGKTHGGGWRGVATLFDLGHMVWWYTRQVGVVYSTHTYIYMCIYICIYIVSTYTRNPVIEYKFSKSRLHSFRDRLFSSKQLMVNHFFCLSLAVFWWEWRPHCQLFDVSYCWGLVVSYARSLKDLLISSSSMNTFIWRSLCCAFRNHPIQYNPMCTCQRWPCTSWPHMKANSSWRHLLTTCVLSIRGGHHSIILTKSSNTAGSGYQAKLRVDLSRTVFGASDNQPVSSQIYTWPSGISQRKAPYLPTLCNLAAMAHWALARSRWEIFLSRNSKTVRPKKASVSWSITNILVWISYPAVPSTFSASGKRLESSVVEIAVWLQALVPLHESS